MIFHLVPKYRKRALSNLALASSLHLSEEEIVRLAKESLINLSITFLEYSKLAKEKDISRIALCENPEEAAQYIHNKKGVIFFCGHQANWEILFLEGTSRMPGVAIGRPIRNAFLYRWILSIREKYGGKMISPRKAVKEGLKALEQGSFLGIVGDQGMPDSGHSYLFLGRRAWLSPLPALLSYRTQSPLIVATLRRKEGKYLIHYADPLFPDVKENREKEVERLMQKALFLLEESICKCPEEWLWIHNFWKQQLPGRIKRGFRYEAICIILPEDPDVFELLFSQIKELRIVYPLEFITLFLPDKFRSHSLNLTDIESIETICYASLQEILKIKDFRFKLVFNCTESKEIRNHFLQLSAMKVVSFSELKKLAGGKDTTHLFPKALLEEKEKKTFLDRMQ